ncbi:MAG: 4-phosphoerythronate dehydrogenase [Nannocystaceae bacterium]
MSRAPVIVVDDAIPWAEQALGELGSLRPIRGGAIDRAALADADALVVRTVPRVDAARLAGTPVRFVGSATAGRDHLDVAALQQTGVTVASAAGCNATAVAQYVLTAMHVIGLERDPSLLAGPIAVVGFGEVGRRVTRLLRSLGATVRVCDPPLAQRRERESLGDGALAELARREPLLPLHECLAGARAVTMHVPLEPGGPAPTVGLLDADGLARLGPDALVVNTARGGVVDESALVHWLDADRGRAVLDVWSGEPAIDVVLADHFAVRLATPHVAGYSLEGKLAGTTMIAAALAQHLERAASWRGHEVLGETETVAAATGPTALARRAAALRSCNPIERDDAALRALLPAPMRQRLAGFEGLRRNYALRRELEHFGLPPGVDDGLLGLGLQGRGRAAIVLVAHGSPDPTGVAHSTRRCSSCADASRA